MSRGTHYLYQHVIDEEIIELLKEYPDGLSRDQINLMLGIPKTTIYDHYNRGCLGDTVERIEIKNVDRKGRKTKVFKLKR